MPAAGQHISQPFKFFWDFSGAVDRFELKLDTGVYANIGLPSSVVGTYSLQADPSLIGSHSAVVRACTGTVCTPDSNTVAFTVDQPFLPPPTAQNLKVAIGGTLPPPLVESPSGIEVTTVGGGPIIDSLLVSWTFGPKDPLVEGGVQLVIKRNGVVNGAATVLCYAGRVVYVNNTPMPDWYKWVDDATLARKGSFVHVSPPVGCV